MKHTLVKKKYVYLLQNKLNKQLLKLLVTVIDAKLFKTVVVEDFESVNIQDSDHRAFAVTKILIDIYEPG